MIQQFVDRFLAKKPELEALFATKHPEDYKEIVTNVVRVISDDDEYNDPDPERVNRSMMAIIRELLFLLLAAKAISCQTIGTQKRHMVLAQAATLCKR